MKQDQETILEILLVGTGKEMKMVKNCSMAMVDTKEMVMRLRY